MATPSLHNANMVEKHPKRPRDLNEWAKRMVDLATDANTIERPSPDSVEIDADVTVSKTNPPGSGNVRRRRRFGHT
jgi:hypothetical protein